MIGALVVTDKPVVVNSGSFGSNSTKCNKGNQQGEMLVLTKSFQLKNWERIYFVKGLGTDEIERVLLIANEDNTKIFFRRRYSFKTLNKGEYADIDGKVY
jgi:hypothetical protein